MFWKKRKLDTLDGALITTHGSTQNEYPYRLLLSKIQNQYPKSIWSNWCFEKSLRRLKTISYELSDQVYDLLINAESALYVDEALAVSNSKKITTDGKLPDIKTLLHTKLPTVRYVHINVRYKWSELSSEVITDCIEDPNTELN